MISNHVLDRDTKGHYRTETIDLIKKRVMEQMPTIEIKERRGEEYTMFQAELYVMTPAELHRMIADRVGEMEAKSKLFDFLTNQGD